MKSRGSGLLVSVRNVAEAAAALEGGADIIDVKEPSRGPLGRADDQTIAEVVRLVDKRRPVSAALGDWTERPLPVPQHELAFIKWGLAGWRGRDWRHSLAKVVSGGVVSGGIGNGHHSPLTTHHSPRPVVVAYADWQQADAPPVDEIVETARKWRCALLLDTFRKVAGATLLDWLSIRAIEKLCVQCRQAEVRVALAGSLGPDQIVTLGPARPDWFAVRGAACEQGRRNAAVQASRVRDLADLLADTKSTGSHPA